MHQVQAGRVNDICCILYRRNPICKGSCPTRRAQGLVAIFLLFIIFHIMYDYTIKGANDEKIKF